VRRKSLPAAIVLGFFACGAAKAAVTYDFFDASDPTILDLEFTVAAQLDSDPAQRQQDFISVGGAFASDYTGGQVRFLDVGQPTITFGGTTGFVGNFTFTGLGPNVVPGNGAFSGFGVLGVPRNSPLASLGSATISGVTGVPEPASWALLSLGFLGLAALGFRLKRDSSAPAR
jgi:hypothetical protein